MTLTTASNQEYKWAQSKSGVITTPANLSGYKGYVDATTPEGRANFVNTIGLGATGGTPLGGGSGSGVSIPPGTSSNTLINIEQTRNQQILAAQQELRQKLAIAQTSQQRSQAVKDYSYNIQDIKALEGVKKVAGKFISGYGEKKEGDKIVPAVRFEGANKILYERQQYEDNKQKLATALQQGKQVYYTPEGAYISEQPQPKQSQGVYSSTNEWIKSTITEPLIFKPLTSIIGKGKQPEYNTTLDEQKLLNEVHGTKNIFSYLPYPKGYREGVVKGIVAGKKIVYEQYKDIREEPLKQGLLLGIGAATSFVVSGAVKGATMISPIVGTGVKATATVGGLALTGLYGYNVYKDLKTEPDFYAKAGTLGVAAKDLVLFGIGAEKGQKAYQQVSGYIATRGRQEVLLKDLTTKNVLTGEKMFPEAPKNVQYKIFIEGKAGKAIGESPGAFHTTPEKFWTKGLLKPTAGTSELPGLYGSAYVSPYFAKVVGSGSKAQIKLFSISIAATEPGIAYLEPKAFRVNPFKKVTPYKIGEQNFKFGFTKQVKSGYADIPLQKTEIEAVFREGAGAYEFKSGKYYTKIKGVRVPIDVFKYASEEPISLTKTSKPTLTSRGYSYPGKSSLVSPESSLGLSLSKTLSEPVSRLSKARTSYVSRLSRDMSYSSSPRTSRVLSYVSKLTSDISVPKSMKSYSYVSKPSETSYPREPKPYYPYYSSRKKKTSYYPTKISLDFGLKKAIKSDIGYDVFKIVKGKPVTIAKGLYKGAALDIGAKSILKDLSATFGVRRSDLAARDVATNREFQQLSNMFRAPKGSSRYKKYGEVYIQKSTRTDLGTGRLTSRGEKTAIQEARMKNVMRLLR